jgi:hypothetical protein
VPVAYPLIRPKSHISNIGHDGTLSFGNFIMMFKNFKNHNFEALYFTLAYALWPGSGQKFKIGYDGILFIENFILMIKITFYFSAAR